VESEAMSELTAQQKKSLVDEISRVRQDIISGHVTGIFLVTVRSDEESDHVAFAGKGKYFELLGQAEKAKFDVQLKIHQSEISD
jgi:hypothetical protein